MLGQAERLFELREHFRRNDETQGACTIAFTSGKGGTGKTFLSLNISYELSLLNKRVLYVDLDFNLANAHLMLNINPSVTSMDFFLRRKMLPDVITKYSGNFHLIFGDSGRTGYPEISSIQLESLLTEVKKLNYDFIILDLPAGAGKSILETLSFADFSIITATTEPTAVMDAYALSKLIKYENIRTRQLVLVNRCRSLEQGEFAYNSLNSACEHFLKRSLELISCISNSNEAYESVCIQKLAVLHFKNAAVCKEISFSAAKINEIAQLANIHHPIESVL